MEQDKISLIVYRGMFEVIRTAAFRKRIKPSELIRSILASDPELRSIARELGVDLEAGIKQKIGGDNRKVTDKATEVPSKPLDASRPPERPVAAQSNGNGTWQGKTVPKPS